jgi:hypothetical protein
MHVLVFLNILTWERFPLQAHCNGLCGRCNDIPGSMKVGYVLSRWATFIVGGRAPLHVVNNESTEFEIPDS